MDNKKTLKKFLRLLLYLTIIIKLFSVHLHYDELEPVMIGIDEVKYTYKAYDVELIKSDIEIDKENIFFEAVYNITFNTNNTDNRITYSMGDNVKFFQDNKELIQEEKDYSLILNDDTKDLVVRGNLKASNFKSDNYLLPIYNLNVNDDGLYNAISAELKNIDYKFNVETLSNDFKTKNILYHNNNWYQKALTYNIILLIILVIVYKSLVKKFYESQRVIGLILLEIGLLLAYNGVRPVATYPTLVIIFFTIYLVISSKL